MDDTKLKSLMPALRERKRYLHYQVISETNFDQKLIESEITKAKNHFFGTYLGAKAGIMILKNKFSGQGGIIRVGHKYVDHLKTALGTITKIDNHDAIVRTTTVSGILKKAIERPAKVDKE